MTYLTEYVIDGIKVRVKRETVSEGPTILEHMVNYLLDLMDKEKAKKEE